MEMIHKKNGRLHIYVRQDKYKGELKSHNWVGRTYINGKQKIISSGTTNLEDAIPILEKWYDDLQISAEQKDLKLHEDKASEIEKSPTTEKSSPSEVIEAEIPQQAESDALPKTEMHSNQKQTTKTAPSQSPQEPVSATKSRPSLFEKLKNIKISIPSLGKKDTSSNSTQIKKVNQFSKKIESFFKSKVSKMSVTGEEIIGLDITTQAIRVAQVSKDKSSRWVLDKFSYRMLDPEKLGDSLLEHKDYLSEEIKLALANAKITTKNAAISIPVTSAIIRVVTSPLMTEEELKKAIETDSLWENLVQITDNLNDYSIFHQVINRNSKNNTMDILFVASKLSDVNSFSSIIKKADLSPVIMDVRCFTLKNAFDNISLSSAGKSNSALMEFGLEENYFMIIHNNIPIITDIFLRPQEKQNILQANPTREDDESRNVIRRYCMQIKQAIAEYENKYEAKINSVNVVSSLKNIKTLVPLFKKNIPNLGFSIFDPLSMVTVPAYNKEKTTIDNRSVFTSVLGLAFRKLDVFGYYKFVTAVKNINLLPNRDTLKQQKKFKFLSGFAIKGLAGTIAGIYLILICFSYFQYHSNKDKLLSFDQIQGEFDRVNERYTALDKQKNEMESALALGKKVSSNQVQSYKALAQITRSVPVRVQFSKLEFDGSTEVTIQGSAFSDQDILNFIGNLNAKSLIEQATLLSMNVSTTGSEQSSSGNKKGFTILCKLKGA